MMQLRIVSLSALLVLLCTGARSEIAQSHIEYARKQIPDLKISAAKGIAYRIRVPDTLDLAERGNLAINALTRIPDPRADYELPFVLIANRKPAVMRFEWSDLVGGQPKFMEALNLLRT